MGMTIDEHIEVLKSYHNGFTGYAGNLQDSIDVAIATMQKYQKIEQIMKETHEGCITKYQKIEEVVEDGNNN